MAMPRRQAPHAAPAEGSPAATSPCGGRDAGARASDAASERGVPRAPDPEQLRATVRLALRQALPLPTYDYSEDVVAEAVAAEVEARLEAAGPDGPGPGPGAPALAVLPAADAADAFGATVADLYASADGGDLADLFCVLERRVGAVVAEAAAAAAAAEAAEMEGRCALCERDTALTFHHLVPRWGAGSFVSRGTSLRVGCVPGGRGGGRRPTEGSGGRLELPSSGACRRPSPAPRAALAADARHPGRHPGEHGSVCRVIPTTPCPHPSRDDPPPATARSRPAPAAQGGPPPLQGAPRAGPHAAAAERGHPRLPPLPLGNPQVRR